MMVHCTLSVIAAALGISLSAQNLTSSFDTSTEGWLVLGTSYSTGISLPPASTLLPALDTANGVPAASLRVTDLFGETGVLAPPSFVGDRLGFFGGTLSWDLFLRYSDNQAYPAVWLVGANKTLSYNIQSPLLNVWSTLSVPLQEGGWRVNSWTGPFATRGEVMAVLADLHGIVFNTEWNTGPDDTNFDQVVMARPTTGVTCYGVECAGANGRWPTLFATGTANSGALLGLEVRDGPANSFALVVLGSGPIAVPIFGCTASILPSPVSILLPLDAVGAANLPLQLPTAAPGPLAWMQSLCLDAGAPSGSGLTLSNGLALVVQ